MRKDRIRHEQERLEQERRRTEEEEQHRREALFDEAAAWQRANNLRAYLAELAGRVAAGRHGPAGYESWRDWARQVLEVVDQSERIRRPD